MQINFFTHRISDNFFENIEEIIAHDEGLKEIPKWIVQCKNLESLDIRNNYISSISEVQFLGKLNTLRISNNPIDSLEPIYYLDKLEHIGMNYTNVSTLCYLNRTFKGTIIMQHTKMAESYIKSVRELYPNATLIYK